MNITRRNFLQCIGVFSFSVAIGIPMTGSISLPAHTLYGVSLEGRKKGNDEIKAAYLGIGRIGLDAGETLSWYLGSDLQRFPGTGQAKLLSMLTGGPTIRDVESCLQDKDIIAVVGSLNDPGFDYARDFALDKAQLIWTIVFCPPGNDDDVIGLTPKPNEVVRVLRHSRYPLDNPAIFTGMLQDLWLCRHEPLQLDEVEEACCELGI